MEHTKTIAGLRKKADLCRRAAAVPSQGGKTEDKLLRSIAEQLDCEAETLERLGLKLLNAELSK